MRVSIYGYSDDLVEIEGDIKEEFSGNNVLLMFGDGTHIRAEYNRDGCWHLSREKVGSAFFELTFTAPGPNSDEYSDRATLEGDLVGVEEYLDPSRLINSLVDFQWGDLTDKKCRAVWALIKQREED